MKRIALKVGALAGVASIAVLAAGPALAASTVSQASAQSLQLSIGSTKPAVSQKINATNDGKTQTRNDASTVPTLADLITGNNVLGAGVAPQDAQAKPDGTSFACAGLAGTGGGLAYVGSSSCNIDGKPLTLNLGSLNLDLEHLLGSQGAISGPLGQALGPLLQPVGQALQQVVSQLTNALASTPLGQISLSGGLSVVEATCTANPDKATGDTEIADTSGDRKIPIALTIPTGTGGTQTLNLADIDVSMPAKPGGTDVVVHLDQLTQALITAIRGELKTALGGAIAQLDPVVGALLQNAQDALITPLVNALQPVLQQVSDNLLKLVVNDVTPGDGGRSVTATALRVVVLGAAKQFTGAGLIEGTIGQVTCGPNARVGTPTTPQTPTTPETPQTPHIPKHVDSGLAGESSHTSAILAATTALLAMAGAAGLFAYRRFWMPKA